MAKEARKSGARRAAQPTRFSGAQLAVELGVDRRTITNWLNADPPCPSHGSGPGRYFLLAEVDAWRQERARREVQAAAPTDIEEARARKMAAEAEMAELQLARARGEVVELAAVEEEARTHNERLAARVKGLGRYVGDVQRAMTDIEAAEVLRRIEDDLLAALSGASDEDEDLIEIADASA